MVDFTVVVRSFDRSVESEVAISPCLNPVLWTSHVGLDLDLDSDLDFVLDSHL